MKIINAGVTAPKGFKCAGLRAGVKPGKTNKDMAMIVSEVPAKIAGTFTKNIVKAAPVLWGKKIVEEQEAVRAVVINTGIANACTGEQGYENVVTEAKEVAKLLDIKPEEVVVGSTGVIGQQLPMDVIKEGIKKLVPELKADRQSEEDASWAILTTDTKPKEEAVEVEINGKTVTTEAAGNGRLDAVSNALKKAYELKYTLETYQEHALERSSTSKAIAYVGIRKPDGTLAWGAGVDPDIIRASIDALVTAINNR